VREAALPFEQQVVASDPTEAPPCNVVAPATAAFDSFEIEYAMSPFQTSRFTLDKRQS
jgi:hypothetical protein